MSGETGFPSPAQGYEASQISLDARYIKNRSATFFFRMYGSFLEYQGIFNDDVFVVDRSLPITSGALIVYQTENEFCCREVVKTSKGLALKTDKDHEELITDNNLIFFGVVVAIIREL